MKFLDKRSLSLFIFSALFLIAFSGIYLIYQYYIIPWYGQSNYEWFYFSANGKFPLKVSLVLSGFKDISLITYSILMSLILCIFDKLFMPPIASKYKILNIVITAFSWTVVLGFIYLIYFLIGNKEISNLEPMVGVGSIKSRLTLLLSFYIITAIPIAWTVNVCYKT